MKVSMDPYRGFRINEAVKSSITNSARQAWREAERQMEQSVGDQNTNIVTNEIRREAAPVMQTMSSLACAAAYKIAVNNYNKLYEQLGEQFETAVESVGSFATGSTFFDGMQVKGDDGAFHDVMDLRKRAVSSANATFQSIIRKEKLSEELEKEIGLKRRMIIPDKELLAELNEKKRLLDESIAADRQMLDAAKAELKGLASSEWINGKATAASADMAVDMRRFFDEEKDRLLSRFSDPSDKEVLSAVFDQMSGQVIDHNKKLVSGGIIETHHMDHQAVTIAQQAKLYKTSYKRNVESLFVTKAERSSETFLQKKADYKRNLSVVKKVGKAADKVAKLERLRFMGIKQVPRSSFRILTKPLQNTEAGRGANVTMMVARPAKTVVKFSYRMTERIAQITLYSKKMAGQIRLAYKMGYRGPIKVFRMAKMNMNAAGIKLNFERDFFKNSIKRSMNRRTDRMLMKQMEKAVSKGKSAKVLDIYEKQVIRKIEREAGTKGTAKAAKKSVHNTIKAEKKLLKVRTAKKWRPNLKQIGQKAFRATQKAIQTTAKAAANGIVTLVKALVTGLLTLISTIVAAIGLPLFIIIIILVLLFLLLWLIVSNLFGFSSLMGLLSNQFDFENKMNILQSCHNQFVEKYIENIPSDVPDEYKFDVYQVVYDDGFMENYAELISAYYVEVNDDEEAFVSGTGATDQVVENILEYLYENTHQVYYEPIEVNGTGDYRIKYGRVHVGIQRDDYLVYEVMQDTFRGRDPYVNDKDLSICPVGTVDSTNWYRTVRNVKALIRLSADRYSSNESCSITVTNPDSGYQDTFQVKKDSGGLISAALAAYYQIPYHYYSSFDLLTMPQGAFPGFTKYLFTDWESLQKGDILVRNGKVAVFDHYDGQYVYVFTNDDNLTIQQGSATKEDTGSAYSVVYRHDNGAGAMTDDEYSMMQKFKEAASGQVAKYANFASSMNIKDEDVSAIILTSNVGDREYDEDGNEIGYEAPFISLVQSLHSNNNGFWDRDGWLDESNGWHSNTNNLTSNKDFFDLYADWTNTLSSLDFVRMIYAQRGLLISSNIYDLATNLKRINPKDLKVGDIILYSNPELTKTPQELINEVVQIEAAIDKYQGQEDKQEMYENERKNAIKQLNHLTIMVYTGQDEAGSTERHAYAYSRDILNGNSGIGKSRKFNIDDSRFDQDRMMCLSVNGILASSVYGCNNLFCGWTDTNIEKYLLYLNKFGEEEISLEEEEVEVVNPDGTVTIRSDFSTKANAFFPEYEEGRFSLALDDIAFSSDFHQDRMIEVAAQALREHGIHEVSPGTIIGLMILRTYYFTDEACLIQNNPFRLKEVYDPSLVSGVKTGALKNYHTLGRDTYVTDWEYNDYLTFADGVLDYAYYMKQVMLANNKSLGESSYYDKRTYLNTCVEVGLMTREEADQIQQFYDGVRYNLTQYDPDSRVYVRTEGNRLVYHASNCPIATENNYTVRYRSLFDLRQDGYVAAPEGCCNP